MLAAALVCGLVSAGLAQGARRGGTVRVAIGADLVTLDPHLSGAAIDRQSYQSLFDKLVDTDENLTIVPMLATSWTASPDGKTVTFKLRQGVKFHDGTPFGAEAVKANFDRMLDPKFPPIRKAEMRPVQRVLVMDPYTVQVVMDKPYSPLLYALTDRAGMMLSPAALAKEGMNFSQRPVGTGPFRFVEHAPQDHTTFERNSDYWAKELPYADRLVFRPITNDASRVANLKSGDVDIVANVPLPQVPDLAKERALAPTSPSMLHVRLYLSAFPGNRGRAPTRSFSVSTRSNCRASAVATTETNPGASPHCGTRAVPACAASRWTARVVATSSVRSK